MNLTLATLGRLAACAALFLVACGSGAALAQGQVTFSTALLDFGSYSMRATSPPRQLGITNTGNAPLTITAVNIPPPFGGSHDCATLGPGARCTIRATFTPTAEMWYSVAVEVHSSVGPTQATLWGYGERSLVRHYYWSILGREPDDAGLAYWRAEASRVAHKGANVNEVWFAMAMGFFAAREYVQLARSDTDFIRDLFATFFNRAPDADGLAFWEDQLDAGLPREVLLAQFMFSPEFRAFSESIFGTATVRAEVDVAVDFYRGLLSRLPDNGGLDYWILEFRVAQCVDAARLPDRIDAISGSFLNSAEYAGRGRTNAQFVGDMYNSFMRRGGDLPGVAFWIRQLDAGAYTRDEVRRAFMASNEFTQRQARVIAQGCMHTVCEPKLSHNSIWFKAEGGAQSVNVTVPAACAYTVSSSAAWLTFEKTSDSTYAYRVAPHTGTINRNAQLAFASTLAGTTPARVSVNQYGGYVAPTDPCLLGGNCRSNGVCCARGLLGCNNGCWGTLSDAYRNGGCTSFYTFCPN